MKLQQIIYPSCTLRFKFKRDDDEILNYSIFVQINDPYIEEITIDRTKAQFKSDGWEFITVVKELKV